MANYQDIHINDLTLEQQYINNFLAGEYNAAFNILANNPQLDTKAFVANVLNTAQTNLSALEANYYNGVENTLATDLATYQNLINNFVDKGDYSSTATYQRYNFVHYNNFIYMWINSASSSNPPLPTNTTYWALIGLRGDEGASGLGLNIRYQWSSAATYATKDLVYYNDSTWVSKQDNNINHIPQDGSSYWLKFSTSSNASITYYATTPTGLYLNQVYFLRTVNVNSPNLAQGIGGIYANDTVNQLWVKCYGNISDYNFVEGSLWVDDYEMPVSLRALPLGNNIPSIITNSKELAEGVWENNGIYYIADTYENNIVGQDRILSRIGQYKFTGNENWALQDGHFICDIGLKNIAGYIVMTDGSNPTLGAMGHLMIDYDDISTIADLISYFCENDVYMYYIKCNAEIEYKEPTILNNVSLGVGTDSDIDAYITIKYI